jgi:nickel-dependent lactate racemase
MTENFKYGRKDIAVSFPAGAEQLAFKEPECTVSRHRFLEELTALLPSDKKCYASVAIVVSDKTRQCGYPVILPWVTEALISKGASGKNITFYIAYGTHPAQSEDESIACFGETYRKYRFIHHQCADDHVFKEVGVTSGGTPVRIRKDVLESSLILTVGAISHHYFAGYGGGRKLLFPGLAQKRSIEFNHGLFLNRDKKKLHEGCQPGNLDGNPVAEDLKEIDEMVPPKISVHGILNSRGEICHIAMGKSYDDFLAACREYDHYFRSGTSGQYDMVVASCGGYPKDINFIQAHKSVHNAAAFVRDEGKLILFSECIDGIGSETFMKYLKTGSYEEVFEVLTRHYEGNGGTALSLMGKTGRINIYLYSSLDESICQILRVRKVSEKDIRTRIKMNTGSLAVIKNAGLLVK